LALNIFSNGAINNVYSISLAASALEKIRLGEGRRKKGVKMSNKDTHE
jgi:hypothetical protein